MSEVNVSTAQENRGEHNKRHNVKLCVQTATGENADMPPDKMSSLPKWRSQNSGSKVDYVHHVVATDSLQID